MIVYSWQPGLVPTVQDNNISSQKSSHYDDHKFAQNVFEQEGYFIFQHMKRIYGEIPRSKSVVWYQKF